MIESMSNGVALLRRPTLSQNSIVRIFASSSDSGENEGAVVSAGQVVQVSSAMVVANLDKA